jgi:hypothetical protein
MSAAAYEEAFVAVHESARGTFRTGLMMSADWSEEDSTSLRRYFQSDPQRIGAFSAHHESSDISCR